MTKPCCALLQGSVNYKFGVLFAREGQMSDDEFYGNGTSSDRKMYRFIDLFAGCWMFATQSRPIPAACLIL